MRHSATTSNAAALVLVMTLAAGPTAAGELVNAGPDGVAVKGYDVVAYFTEGRPVRGDERYAHSWQEATWYFANETHLAAFAAEPARYAPRYGGFCAGGVALGNRSPIDPEAFVIIDGRLYLSFDEPTAENFEATADESIAKADANWDRIGFTD